MKKIGINPDEIARNIWQHLLEDFELQDVFGNARDALLRKDVPSFRKECVRECGIVPPARFKRVYQMQNLLKKYRFQNDVYSDQELSDITNEKYRDTQIRLAKVRMEPRTLRRHLVLQEARKIAKSILGEVNPDLMETLGKFGKKSSIGCPLSLAYIDVKLTNVRAFTGSADVAEWFFRKIVPGDPVLKRIVDRLKVKPGHRNLSHIYLVLENVPKSWKSYRGITKMTLLGLYYTYCIGRTIQNQLKCHGLDIRHLQDKHRKWIRAFSLRLTHVTADVSAASDSIISDLLMEILPRPWYNLLRPAFIRQIKVGGRLQFTESISPMGNGFTFPVETLVFYCITKALGNLGGIRGLYSVYGDDLVYPSRLHPYVCTFFPEIGLVLNLDKTFVSYPFRESCGEDFYRGFAVRSFYLRSSESKALMGPRLEAHLYSIINGLRRRWDDLEIHRTLNYLLLLLSRECGRILRVPPMFPDTSGIRVDNPNDHLLDDWWHPYVPVKLIFSQGSRWFQFGYLKPLPKKRFIVSQEPYYWQVLSGDNDVVRLDHAGKLEYITEVPHGQISWVTIKRKVKLRLPNNRIRHKTVKKRRYYVASRVIELYKLKCNAVGTLSDWNHDRDLSKRFIRGATVRLLRSRALSAPPPS